MIKLPLTEKEHDLLNYIIAFKAGNKYMPSLKEMALAFGLKFPQSIQSRIKALIKKGYLKRYKYKQRSLVLL